MADEAEESALYIQLLKGTVLNLQDRVDQEKKRLARINMYSSRPVYHPYHLSPPRIKPTYPSHSSVFVNPKMNYTRVNSKHTTRAAATSHATASMSLCRKHPAVSVNRTFINPKNNLTLKREPSANGPKSSSPVAQTSSQLSTSTACSIDSRNITLKGDALKDFNTASKVAAVSTSLCRTRPALSVNRTFINPKNNLTLKKEPSANGPKPSAIVTQMSPSLLCTSTASSTDCQNLTLKGDALEDFNTRSKVAAASSQAAAVTCRKQPTIYVNRTFLNPKNNLALKKEPSSKAPKTSAIVAQSSSSLLSTSIPNDIGCQNLTSERDALRDFNTGSKIVTTTSQAAASTSSYRKQPAIFVNRAFLKPNNLALQKVHSTDGLETSTVVTQTSSQSSTSTDGNIINQNPTSKGDVLEMSNTRLEPKTLIPGTQQQKSIVGVQRLVAPSAATPSKSSSENPMFNSPVTYSSIASRTCIASSTPKALTYHALSKSKHLSSKSHGTNAASTPRGFVERRRYKIVREPRPSTSKTVASMMTKQSPASTLRLHTVNTRFNLVKRPDVFMHKSGYSYVSKRCLQKAKVISLSNSEAGKSYVKKLRKLIIDAGKKFDKKPLVMVSKRKISRVPVTPTLPKRKSSVIPHKSKLKVDHRRLIYNLNSSKILISPLIAKHKLSPENRKKWYLGAKRFFNTKFSKLQTVTVQGVMYRVEAGGKNLRRLDSPGPKSSPSTKNSLVSKVSRIHIGGAIFTRTSAGVLKRVNTHKLIVANRAVNKSIATAVAKNRKVHNKRAKKPCLYFNNFGKCKNVKCPYVHDPKKIAVCRRMIQGTCKVSGCPFYHKLDKEKMPTCYYFLKGQCNRDNCIYPHVKVNKNAETCEDFLNGYCSRGVKCTMKHFFVCQKFQEKQVCSHNACKFKAHQITKAKTSISTNKTSEADLGKKKKSISSVRSSSSLKKNSAKLVPSTEPIPITENLSFISLGNSSEDSLLDVSGSAELTSQSNPTLKDQPKGALRIKPRL